MHRQSLLLRVLKRRKGWECSLAGNSPYPILCSIHLECRANKRACIIIHTNKKIIYFNVSCNNLDKTWTSASPSRKMHKANASSRGRFSNSRFACSSLGVTRFSWCCTTRLLAERGNIVAILEVMNFDEISQNHAISHLAVGFWQTRGSVGLSLCSRCKRVQAFRHILVQFALSFHRQPRNEPFISTPNNCQITKIIMIILNSLNNVHFGIV